MQTGPFERLESVLRLLVEEHERLLGLAGMHREAIAGADARKLSECIGKQNEVVQRIAGLERQRQGVVAELSKQRAAPNAVPPPLSAITAKAPEPVRTRLNAVATALRDVLNRLHREHAAIRSAAATLSAHMEGLLRQVCQQVSQAGVYARPGGMGRPVQVVSSVDVRS